MNKRIVITSVVVLTLFTTVAGVFGEKIFRKEAPKDVLPVELPESDASLVRVATPLANSVVTSPLLVSGEARGTWYFEASFPVMLLDGNGREIAIIPAQAKSDWMTTEFVPFEATLVFEKPKTATGVLVLKKDNPSGLPEHDAEVRVPVRFGGETQ